MSDQSRARKVQRATGFTYLPCNLLVTGRLVYTPRAGDCLVVAALADLNRVIRLQHSAITQPCPCPRCDPGDS